MFNRDFYVIRECEQGMKIIQDEMKGLGNKDVHNLKLLLLSIKPRSYFFRRGCIKSLRKAIALFEKKEKGDDTMPSIEHMRSAISDAYSGEGWKYRCEHMRDNQVIAIYRSLLRRGKFDSVRLTDKEWDYIKKGAVDPSKIPGGCEVFEGLGTLNGSNGCTDAPRFVPFTGVQLSIFDL